MTLLNKPAQGGLKGAAGDGDTIARFDAPNRLARALSLIVLASALLLAAGTPAWASEPPPGLKMTAAAAFEGFFKYGEWLPVWAYLENTGADLEAEVQVRVTGTQGRVTFAAPVSLPTGSRKQVPVYVLPNNFARSLEVQLVDTQGQVLVTQQVAVKPQVNITLFVGVAAQERGAISLIAGVPAQDTSRPQVLIDVNLQELPERVEGLRSLDCLILNDVDTSLLTPAQRDALVAWVRQGGRLIVGGGAGARRTVSGLPEDLLPLVPRREIELDVLPGLTEMGGEAVRVPGPFLVSVGDLQEGRTLATQGDTPLVRERIVGDGSVDVSALDLAVSPFDAWSGTIGFWKELVLLRSPYPEGMPADMSVRQMRSSQMNYALTNLPSMALPSVRWVAVLLGAYILLVGPVNYFVLRWRRRMQWAWVTIPAITLIFSGGAFGLAYALRGTDLIVNKVAIVVGQPNGAAVIDTYVGLFSPSRQSYEIEVQGHGLLSSLDANMDPFSSSPAGVLGGEVAFVQGTPGRVRGLAVNQWSMQTFMTEDVWAGFGRIAADLSFAEGALVGKVRNETEQTLQDAVVVLGTQFVRLGELQPGQEVEVRLDLSKTDQQVFGAPISYLLFEPYLQGPGGPPRDVQLRQQILDSILNTGKFSAMSSLRSMSGGSSAELYFLAWFDQAPPDVRVAGREPAQLTTALLYAPLSYRLPESGRISIPAGFVPGRISQMPTDGGMCGAPGVLSVYIGRGTAEFEFSLPPEVRDMQIESMTLSIRSDGGWQQTPEVTLYDWAKGEWVQVQSPVIGDNRIDPAAPMVSEDGLVRARLGFTVASGGGCWYVGLGLDGTR